MDAINPVGERPGSRRVLGRSLGAALPPSALALAFAVALLWSSSTPRPLAGQANRPATPDVEQLDHADFEWRLETLDGDELSFADFRGEVVVLNAWATWCPPCVAEMASFAELRDALGDTRVRFVFITAEEPDHVREWVRRRPWRLPIYIETQRMPEAYGSFGLPTTWIVDREGRIVLRRDGAAHWATPEVESFLRSLAGS